MNEMCRQLQILCFSLLFYVIYSDETFKSYFNILNNVTVCLGDRNFPKCPQGFTVHVLKVRGSIQPVFNPIASEMATIDEVAQRIVQPHLAVACRRRRLCSVRSALKHLILKYSRRGVMLKNNGTCFHVTYMCVPETGVQTIDMTAAGDHPLGNQGYLTNFPRKIPTAGDNRYFRCETNGPITGDLTLSVIASDFGPKSHVTCVNVLVGVREFQNLTCLTPNPRDGLETVEISNQRMAIDVHFAEAENGLLLFYKFNGSTSSSLKCHLLINPVHQRDFTSPMSLARQGSPADDEKTEAPSPSVGFQSMYTLIGFAVPGLAVMGLLGVLVAISIRNYQTGR